MRSLDNVQVVRQTSHVNDQLKRVVALLSDLANSGDGNRSGIPLILTRKKIQRRGTKRTLARHIGAVETQAEGIYDGVAKDPVLLNRDVLVPAPQKRAEHRVNRRRRRVRLGQAAVVKHISNKEAVVIGEPMVDTPGNVVLIERTRPLVDQLPDATAQIGAIGQWEQTQQGHYRGIHDDVPGGQDPLPS